MARIVLIVAMDSKRGIGKDNAMPWVLPEDLKHFKKETGTSPIIMGRKTYESIGRLLPKRHNIVITRDVEKLIPDYIKSCGIRKDGATMAVANSLDRALVLAEYGDITTGKIFIIGGGEIFKQAMDLADEMIITEIGHDAHCDTFFPAFDKKDWNETHRRETILSTNIKVDYVYYERIRTE